MASRETVIKMFALFAANWPKEPQTPMQVQLYERVLEDVPDAILETAALDIIASSEWFPKAAEVRRAAFRILEGQGQLPTAGQAWGEVRSQMLRVGMLGPSFGGMLGNISRPEWGKLQFSHPIIMQAVKAMGGWNALLSSFDEMADRAHFFKVYEQLAQREQRAATMLPDVKEAMAQIDAGNAPQLEAGK